MKKNRYCLLLEEGLVDLILELPLPTIDSSLCCGLITIVIDIYLSNVAIFVLLSYL